MVYKVSFPAHDLRRFSLPNRRLPTGSHGLVNQPRGVKKKTVAETGITFPLIISGLKPVK